MLKIENNKFHMVSLDSHALCPWISLSKIEQIENTIFASF